MTAPPPYGDLPSSPDPDRPAGYPPGPFGAQQGYPPPNYQQPGYSQPGYPQPRYPQPGYPQPGNPAYQQPGHPGSQPPGYLGQTPTAYHPADPATGGSSRPTRPGLATAAAVLAFVFGAFAIIASLGVLLLQSVGTQVCNGSDRIDSAEVDRACSNLPAITGPLKVIAVILIVVAILMIWGGVTTLSGRNTQILAAGALLYFVAVIVGVISSRGFAPQQVVGLVIPVLILVFLLNPAVRRWVRTRGGRTF